MLRRNGETQVRPFSIQVGDECLGCGLENAVVPLRDSGVFQVFLRFVEDKDDLGRVTLDCSRSTCTESLVDPILEQGKDVWNRADAIDVSRVFVNVTVVERISCDLLGVALKRQGESRERAGVLRKNLGNESGSIGLGGTRDAVPAIFPGLLRGGGSEVNIVVG